MRRAPVVLVGVTLACLAGAAAHAALPERAAALIAAAARDGQRSAEHEQALATALDNRDLALQLARSAQQRAEGALSTAVVTAIAENPRLVGEIVATAVTMAPALADGIVATASEAYPGFAATIRAAAGGEVPARTPEDPEPRTAAPVAETSASDPLEGLNRAVFAINDQIDVFIVRPIAAGYGYVTPDVAKRAVRNAFENLGAPVVLANDVLQFAFTDAAITTGRFVVNSTVGVLGLFDVATEFGLPYHPADFGQTLHHYGVGPGFYLVLPLLGPSTLRDGVGTVVDGFLDPFNYVLRGGERIARAAGDGVVRHEALLWPIEDLRAGAVDFYAATRSAYFQDRAVVLNKGVPPTAPDLDRMFEEMP